MAHKTLLSHLLSTRRGTLIFSIVMTGLAFESTRFTRKLIPHAGPNAINIVSEYLTGLFFLVITWRLLKRGLVYYKLPRMSLGSWAVVGVLAGFTLLPSFITNGMPIHNAKWFGGLLLYCFGIGVGEEFLSRGFIFIATERFGFWWAVNISSITFGLMHLLNFMGPNNHTYIIFQVINAAASGYFLCGLMIFSRSIWVPVFFHAMFDLPLIPIDGLGQGQFVVTASVIRDSAINFFLYFVMGIALIWIRRGLIEKPGSDLFKV